MWNYPKEIWALIKCFTKIKSAADSISAAPQKYEGLYEPVFRLMQNPKFPVSALKEWNVRADYLYPGSSLAELTKFCAESAWSEKHPEKAAKLLLNCIEKAGVTRETLDESNRLTVSPLQASAYRALDGHTIYAEETITVITAAWYCKEMVVEHGMVGEF